MGKTRDRKILPLLEALREGSVMVRSLPGATAAASWTAPSPEATSAMAFAISGGGATDAGPCAAAGAASPDSSMSTSRMCFTTGVDP